MNSGIVQRFEGPKKHYINAIHYYLYQPTGTLSRNEPLLLYSTLFFFRITKLEVMNSLGP